MARLRSEGYLVCSGSSPVPVEVRGVRPDGVGLLFRCRGTAIRLALYRPGRAVWQIAVRDKAWCPEESLQLWTHHPLGTPDVPTDARLAFPRGTEPDQELVIDGARVWGWCGHEAGLLRPAAAAPLFDRLMATVARSGGARSGLALSDRIQPDLTREVAVPAARSRARGKEGISISIS
ncbi:hypothetical protein ThrDRAFT_00613 [Frankia casuarinae]|uniref:hypothetical protein n=2 Tax=Frankia TaxID=1854 RepID=UPI00044CE651|nr:hypothetical protein [Frankia casuarinae]EYT93861.1 hypothetical protein ThrDRAFT_00613 [Frankia casuarinae]KEZ37126.1 hypothetical protein CEDDRAFT_01378 [Frankia sp. CeD]